MTKKEKRKIHTCWDKRRYLQSQGYTLHHLQDEEADYLPSWPLYKDCRNEKDWKRELHLWKQKCKRIIAKKFNAKVVLLPGSAYWFIAEVWKKGERLKLKRTKE